MAAELDLYHMHNGPFAGELMDRAQMTDFAFRHGYWPIEHDSATTHWVGRYVQDRDSAGGRDWDWSDD